MSTPLNPYFSTSSSVSFTCHGSARDIEVGRDNDNARDIRSVPLFSSLQFPNGPKPLPLLVLKTNSA